MINERIKNILIIEDDESLNEALVDKLREEGFNTSTAFNGEDGLALAIQEHPDVILLDLLMPIMDGYAFMESLRKDTWGSEARVIILTNYSMSEEKVAKTVLQHHPTSFLVKSSTKLRDVVTYIKEALAT